MQNLPQIEILEERHRFPCIFVFKVIGSSEDGFVGRVVCTMRDVLDIESDPPFIVRQTRSGRHVAITFEPEVADAYQVLAVYKRLTTVKGVVMLL